MAANSDKGAAAPWKRPLLLKTGREKEADVERTAANMEDEPLSPVSRLFHQPGLCCFIISIMGCGKPLDVGSLKAVLEATLPRHPRFSSIPVLDEVGWGKKPRWVPMEVVVEDHIVVPNLMQDSSSASSTDGSARSADQAVEDYISSLTTAPMDPTRPLWELHVLNVRTSEAAAVAVLRLHHSLGDGTSLVSLLLACTRKASDPDALPTIPSSQPRHHHPPSRRKNDRSSAPKLLLFRIWASLVVAWNTLVGLANLAATVLFLKDTPTPISGTEGVELRPKRIVHRTVSLDDVKLIKDAMRCTVNDVMVGVTSAGLSRYLSRRYSQKMDNEDDREDQFPTKLPSNIRLLSTLMVDIRSKPIIKDLKTLVREKNGKKMWGNLIGFILIPFRIKKEDDPLDYIRQAKQMMSKKKKSMEAFLVNKIFDIIVKYAGTKVAGVLYKRIMSYASICFSNVVGPTEELAMDDNPIVYLVPTIYGLPSVLTIHLLSYKNTMKIVMAADEENIPDPHQLMNDLVHSFYLMKRSIPIP